jgi:hypothetical protein
MDREEEAAVAALVSCIRGGVFSTLSAGAIMTKRSSNAACFPAENDALAFLLQTEPTSPLGSFVPVSFYVKDAASPD